MKHFHVRWDNSKMDWEAFKTEEEAKAQGERLKRPGETYLIVQLDGDCPACSKLKARTWTLESPDTQHKN